jgi:hypothetical protein
MGSDYEMMQTQMHECTECLKAFLVKAIDKQPALTEHAEIIREHLETLRRELDVLAARLVD